MREMPCTGSSWTPPSPTPAASTPQVTSSGSLEKAFAMWDALFQGFSYYYYYY